MIRIATAITIAASVAAPAIALANQSQSPAPKVGVAVTGEPTAIGSCSTGDLTLRRLSDASCIARIAIPTPRPDPSVAEAAPEIEQEGATAAPTFDYVEIAGDGHSAAKRIRLVGPRFLPARDESLDLKRQATVGNDPLNAMFQGVVAALGLGVTPAVAEERPEQTAQAKADRVAQLSELR